MTQIRLALMPITLFALTLTSHGQASKSGDSIVRRCTAAEFATSSSPEASQLIAKYSTNTELPSFRSCEAVVISWLSNALILRFHTPVHVDFSNTYVFVRATKTSRMRLIRSGRGMYVSPSLSDANNLDALNDLIQQTEFEPNNKQIAAVSNLYFLLLDAENRDRLSLNTDGERALSKTDYKTRIQKKGKTYLVSLSTTTGLWVLHYSLNAGRLHLDSVDRETSKPRS